jgi:hypothetical protein
MPTATLLPGGLTPAAPIQLRNEIWSIASGGATGEPFDEIKRQEPHGSCLFYG